DKGRRRFLQRRIDLTSNQSLTHMARHLPPSAGFPVQRTNGRNGMAPTLAVSAVQQLRVALAGPLSAPVSDVLRRHALSVVELDTPEFLDAVILLPGADPESVYARMLHDGHSLAAVIDLSGAHSARAD